MWRFLVRLFAVIGLLGVILVGLVGYGAWWAIGEFGEPEPLADEAVLTLDLADGVAFAPPRRLAVPFAGGTRPTVAETARAIEHAADDPRVTALVAELGGGTLGLASAQELRRAVMRWRDSGKPALAYAGSFSGNAAYYLASAFDEVWLRAEGQVALTGIRIEVPFAFEALDALSLLPEFQRAGIYKTFPDSLTERGFTETHREMTTGLARDLFAQLVGGVAEGRALPPDGVRALIDQAPLLAEEAQAAGLIDRIGDDGAFEQAWREHSGTAEPVSPGDYLDRIADEQPAPAARIALIHVDGTIADGADGDGPGAPFAVARAGEIAEAIDEAVEREDIDAILLRIDSGGGSVIATAVIASAADRAVEAGVPLAASLGSAAASGGYWIAAKADAIIAQPATLTGSIGVFAGKIATRDLWARLGVRWGIVQEGAQAGIHSMLTPYSDAEAARIEAAVDSLYDRFVARVAAGRGLDPASIEAIAEGRVWTGAQAHGLGLIDALGGQAQAIDRLIEALALPPESPVDLVTLPEPPGPLETLHALMAGGGSLAARPAAVDDHLAAAAAGLLPLLTDSAGPRLVMPPLILR